MKHCSIKETRLSVESVFGMAPPAVKYRETFVSDGK